MARKLTALLLSAAILVLTAATLAPVAHADGDPASDVLLGENVYYPYSPAVTGSVAKTLNAETAATSKAKFPIKVALIANPTDLGVIPDLFGKPQKYADFLVQEISFESKQHLLVVMRAGYGVQGLGAKAKSAITTLPAPKSGSSDDLARAAIVAVAKLARASGHPIAGVSGVPGGSGAGSSAVLIVLLLVVAALAAAGAVIVLRRRPPPAAESEA
jgi:hypothetical protein